MSRQGATPTSVAEPVAVGRVDALGKVRGEAIYAADRTGPELLHAMLATATIGRGRLTRLDTAAAEAAPGVRLILTSQQTAGLQPAEYSYAGGYGFQSLQVMADDRIAYRGQPIALAVADTLEAAIEAANLITATALYEPETPYVTLDTADTDPYPISDVNPDATDRVLGDADRAVAEAEIQVDQEYESAPQHHNPMELISTVAEWQGETLVIHEGTQNAGGVQHGVATVLGIDPANVQVISPSVGGGFGQKFALYNQTALVAFAARQLGRPVKIVRPRAQIFHDASFRPASRHRLRIGGSRSGQLVAAIHETVQQTSRHDGYTSNYSDLSATMYGWEHFRGHEDLVALDAPTPGYMRCPNEHVAAFALESAVDEFATLIGMDPVDLRLMNDTDADVVSGLPFSARHVAECLQRGADLFGWADRSPEPGSMVAENGDLIGWGVALGSYPAQVAPAVVRLRLDAAGQATVRMSGHEMGQGIQSLVMPLVMEALRLPAERIEIRLGDTRAAPQHMTAGGWGSASIVAPLRRALDDLLDQVRALDGDREPTRPPHEALAAAGRDAIETDALGHGPSQEDAEAEEALAAGLTLPDGPVYPEFTAYSYVAQFVEVRVTPTTRQVRVPRVVSVVDCGRVINPVTAASQVYGCVVWGIGGTLQEGSEIDSRYGGVLNANIGDYVIPVNADIGAIEFDFINEPDTVFDGDGEGVKSLSQVVMAGIAPAIANAIWHATGRRVRHLPIRLEDLL